MRLGNEISRRGIMIYRQVGIACEAIARRNLVPIVPKLSPSESRPILAGLQEIDRTRVSFDDVMRQERSYFYRQLRATGADIDDADERSVLASELALRCYLADKSSIPARLEELVPEYLRRVPEDPFVGRPLIYRPQGTNWLLYSVGPDRVDDGGRPGRYWSSCPGDLPYNGP